MPLFNLTLERQKQVVVLWSIELGLGQPGPTQRNPWKPPIFLRFYLLLYIMGVSPHVCLCTLFVQCPEARRGHRILWKWSYRQSWATKWDCLNKDKIKSLSKSSLVNKLVYGFAYENKDGFPGQPCHQKVSCQHGWQFPHSCIGRALPQLTFNPLYASTSLD